MTAPELPAPEEVTVPSADAILDALDASDEQAATRTTDTADGERFARVVGPVARYAVDLRRWLLWDGVALVPDTEESLGALALTRAVTRHIREVEALAAPDENPDGGGGPSPRERLLRHATATEDVPRRRRILQAAACVKALQVREDDLDVVGTDLVCRNGTVNLDTGELRPSRPADLNTRSCAVAYDPAARSDLLDEFLATFLPDELDQRFVFAVLGQALRAGNETRTFPLVVGGTTSGKSQLFAALHRLLGSYACAVGSSVFRGNLDDRPRPDLVHATYTRLAVASEASKGWALHGDQVKRLTGGDPLPYRNLYGQVVNVLPRFTPVLVTNEVPRITGADRALRRRIIVVRFDVSLPPDREDPEFKKRFVASDEVARALLARLVRGARDAVAGELKKIPTRYVLATMDAHGELDHVDEFLAWLRDEGVLAEAGDDTPGRELAKASALHEHYVAWITKHGDKIDKQDALNLRALGEALRQRGWTTRMAAGTRWVGQRLVVPVGT